MSLRESSSNALSPKSAGLYSEQLSLYDKYGAMAYGVILQIIPQEQLAQEVLVELFSGVPLNNCDGETTSKAICILRNARSKAIEFKNRFRMFFPLEGGEKIDSNVNLSKTIFNLSFKEGVSLDTIAQQLSVPKDIVLKSLSEHIKSFRQS